MAKRKRFATGETKKIYLPDSEDYILVKMRLSTGDQKRLENAGLRPTVVDGKLFNVIDWAIHDVERVSIFVTDWNLKDNDTDKDIKYNIDALKALDPDTFIEINDAVLTHVMEQAKAKKQEREEREAATKSQTPPAEEGSEPTL